MRYGVILDSKNFSLYAVVKKDVKQRITSFSFGSKIDKMRQLLSSHQIEEVKPELPKLTLKKDEGANLGAALYKMINAIQGQAELASIIPVINSSFSRRVLVQDIVGPLEQAGDVIEEDGISKMYGVPLMEKQKFLRKVDRFNRVKSGLAALPAAVLMSTVATFDSLMADIVRNMLSLRADNPLIGARNVSLSDVLQANTIEDLKERVIADEIYEFSRGSHDDQVSYIEKHFNVDIRSKWERWPDFVEIFERRNLIAHGEKTYTKRYAEICAKHGHPSVSASSGANIEITSNYLKLALDVLLEFVILLVFTLWRKQLPKEIADACSVVNNVSVRLVEGRSFSVAMRVLEHVLGLKITSMPDETKKKMTMNLASAYRHADQKDKCNKVLDSMDWSGSGPEYRLCVAALKEDLLEVARLLPLAVRSEAISQDQLTNWPVFNFVKKTEEFRTAYNQVFGARSDVEERSESYNIEAKQSEEKSS